MLQSCNLKYDIILFNFPISSFLRLHIAPVMCIAANLNNSLIVSIISSSISYLKSENLHNSEINSISDKRRRWFEHNNFILLEWQVCEYYLILFYRIQFNWCSRVLQVELWNCWCWWNVRKLIYPARTFKATQEQSCVCARDFKSYQNFASTFQSVLFPWKCFPSLWVQFGAIKQKYFSNS